MVHSGLLDPVQRLFICTATVFPEFATWALVSPSRKRWQVSHSNHCFVPSTAIGLQLASLHGRLFRYSRDSTKSGLSIQVANHAQLTADTWRLAPTFDLAQTKSEREINISPIVVYTATHTSTEERRCSSYVEQVRRRASPWVQFSSRGAAVGMSVGEIICCLTKPIKASTWVFFFRISRGGGLREVRSLRINIRLRCQK